ncbi:amidase family protein [Actinoplanes sichuanensis]|uniref:Amidase n=1 Tax=Actinoplanes sichuanensis TaxID=512349 RepID=A0ABW4AUJ6_9ACTN|nr:amidase [Actinoplanes sichuanensis]BEL04439.1 amidase family protein [Actinoplanes sichuanensis]
MTGPTSDDELCFTPATDLARLIRTRQLSPVEVTAAVLDRIERVGSRLNCFVTVVAEQAMAAAKDAERRVVQTAAAELPALHGIPVTVKDLEATAGVRTTFGSVRYADHVPATSAPIWQRMHEAGAVLVGKTTTPEFGMHGITESRLTGVTNNPWDLSRTTGGSSGGAAAAVAAGLAPLATGSDGGGSIRVPASLCGAVGFKPTIGRIPFATPDSGAYEAVTVTGPITRTVADAALMFEVVAGELDHDAVSILGPAPRASAALHDATLRGLRVAYSPDLGCGPVDPETDRVVRAAVGVMAAEGGAEVEEVTIHLPDPYDYFVGWWGPHLLLELALMAEDGITLDDCPDAVRPLVERAASMSAVDFVRVQMVTRSQIYRAFADVFARFDLLVWPTTPLPAFEHPGAAGGPLSIAGRPVREPAMENQRLTEAISHAGCPAITVPAGFTHDGLPVGLQIAARRGADIAVLRAAAAFEAIAPWAHRRPPLR